MSTPNPTHIIADHHAEHGEAGSQQIPGCCCGWQGEVLEHPPWNPIPGVADALHAAHVVSKLTDAGYSIVPRRDIVRIYRAASTLGRQYMMPMHFGADLEEAERWFALQQKMLGGLSGADTVRLEYQDMWVTTWEPLDAAAAEEEKP